MGSKLMSIDEIRFLKDNDADNNANIVFDDLVKTLQIDPTKYDKPVLNEHNEVIFNEVYVRAAREANMTQLIVEGPWNTHYFATNLTESDEILRNHIFFQKDIRNYMENHQILEDIFEQYTQRCKKLIETGSIISKGRVESTEVKFPAENVLTYILYGKLISPENKRLLTEPTKRMYADFDVIAGPIRSVNGIKYEHH